MVLTQRAIEEGRLTLRTRLTDVIAIDDIQHTDDFREITIKHLLEHTHGLDDFAIPSAPLLPSGYLDHRTLCQQLSDAHRLAEPGALYSYSRAGAWLLAAVLEGQYCLTYGEILRSKLFQKADIHWDRVAESADLPVCAAADLSVKISVTDMLKLLRPLLTGAQGDFFGESTLEIERHCTELPGWSLFERAIFLGWKYYSAGWFGHNSTLPDAAWLIRLNPIRRIAIIICADNPAACWATVLLFGGELPGAVTSVPALLHGNKDLSKYVGTFSRASLDVSIKIGDRGTLCLDVHEHYRSSSEAAIRNTSTLFPAKQHVFFAQPPILGVHPFIQFVQQKNCTFDYLWTGQYLIRRKTG